MNRRVAALLVLAAFGCSTPVEKPPDDKPPVVIPPVVVDGDLRGKVVVGTAAMPGARVAIAGSGEFTTTGADGTFLLKGLVPGSFVLELASLKAPFEAARFPVVMEPGSGALANSRDVGTITLGVRENLFVSVHDGADDLEGVVVAIQFVDAAVTDADGEARFNLVGGQYDVGIILPDGRGFSQHTWHSIGANPPTRVDFNVATGGVKTAKISGKVAPFTLVAVDVLGGPKSETATIDGTGGFTTGELAAGLYSVRIRRTGARDIVVGPVAAVGATEIPLILATAPATCSALTGDGDADGVADAADKCPCEPRGSLDVDNDGLCDVFDHSFDGDDIDDAFDNCPALANQDQLDTNDDGTGDACTPVDVSDRDGDGAPYNTDKCPFLMDNQADRDSDGIGDACDACPTSATTCPVEPDVGLCDGTVCFESPRPTTGFMTWLHGSSPTDVWMLDGTGDPLHFDGAKWTRIDGSAGMKALRPTRIFARAANDAWAYGGGSPAHWDGATWTDDTRVRSDAGLRSAWSMSANATWFAGSSGVRLFDGTDFSDVVTAAHDTLGAIHGGPNGEVWAGGYGILMRKGPSDTEFSEDGPTIDQYGEVTAIWSDGIDLWVASTTENGEAVFDQQIAGTWSHVLPPGVTRILALTGTSGGKVFALDSDNTVLAWLGGKWQVLPRAPIAYVKALWVDQNGHAWVAGSGGLARWNGARWLSHEPGVAAPTLAVHGTGPDNVWTGGVEVRQWDGTDWQPLLTPFREIVTAIWSYSATDTWFFTDNGSAWHRAGTTWTPYVLGIGTPNDAWGITPTDLWVTGTEGAAHFGGADFTRQEGIFVDDGAGPPSPSGVWASGTDDVWFSTNQGTIRGHGASWRLLSTDEGADIWGTSANDVWVAGRTNQMWHWTGGSTFTSVNVAAAMTEEEPNLRKVWGAGGLVYALSDKSEVILHSSDGWVAYWTATWAPLTNLWAAASTGLWLVGDNVAEQANGHVLSALATRVPQNAVRVIAGRATGDAWALGWDGLAMRRADGVWHRTTIPLAGGYSAAASFDDGNFVIGGENHLGAAIIGPAEATYEVIPQKFFNANAIGGTAANDAWLVGDRGFVSHRTGTNTWMSLSPVLPGLENFALLGVATTVETGWIVGEGATFLTLKSAGWQPEILPSGVVAGDTYTSVDAVQGDASVEAWAVASSGTVLRYGGIGWSIVTGAPSAPHRRVRIATFNDVWILSQSTPPAAHHWTGTAWVTTELPALREPQALKIMRDGTVWVGGPDAALVQIKP